MNGLLHSDQPTEMAAARLTACLGAAPDQRAAAYTELTALAHGDAADATTGIATATLHVGGLEGEALEDEAKLAERLGTFGTVLAVTLRREAGSTPEARTATVAAALDELRAEGSVPMLDGWRDEAFAIRTSFFAPAALTVERAAAGLFGAPAYGVFVTGYTRRCFSP